MPHPIITDGQAKRLARHFHILTLYRTGAIHAEDARLLNIAVPPDGCRDQHGWDADRRALADYVDRYGPRTAVDGWERLKEDDAVIPWAYGR